MKKDGRVAAVGVKDLPCRGPATTGETIGETRARAVLDAAYDLRNLFEEERQRREYWRAAQAEALDAIEVLAAAIYREAGTLSRSGREEDG